MEMLSSIVHVMYVKDGNCVLALWAQQVEVQACGEVLALQAHSRVHLVHITHMDLFQSKV